MASARLRWGLASALALHVVAFSGRAPQAARRAPALTDPQRWLEAGAYERVVAWAARRTDLASARLAAAAEVALGHRRAARAHLEQASVRAPRDLAIRADLVDVLATLGERDAVADLVALTDEERPADPARLDLSNRVALARLERAAGRWQQANALLRALVKEHPEDLLAQVTWGRLLLEKHAVGEAETSFREAVARAPVPTPFRADAYAGLARALVEGSGDRSAAQAAVARALQDNPRHAEALTLKGELALDSEDVATVDATVAQLRAVRPDDPGAAWLAAARARLADDEAGYARERQAHQAAYPQQGEFFHQVAEALVRQRRYDDARTVAREGTAVDPGHAGCLSSLGLLALRQGDETEGLQALRAAFDLDPFDARAFNLLNLFERVIPRDYVSFAHGPFRFRTTPEARPAVESVVAPFLVQVYRRYVERYGVTPRGPLLVELYAERAHFAVRTVGFPHLDVAAVCFGRVITSQSPTNGAFNWALVLAHELAHVFAIELSGGRVPRWFTEGLAELETSRLDGLAPPWQRHAALTHYRQWRRGAIPPLPFLSRAFLEARSPAAAVAAYMHATIAVEWLERNAGFAAIKTALLGWGGGRSVADGLHTLTGRNAGELDVAFAAELERRYAGYKRQFLPPRDDPEQRPAWEEKAARADATAAERARAALLALDAGELTAARRWLQDDASSAEPVVVWARARLAEADGKPQDAEALLQTLLPRADGYDVRLRLGLLAVARGDAGAAELHFRRASLWAPEEVEPHALLAELYKRTARPELRAVEQDAAFALSPQSLALARDRLAAAQAVFARQGAAGAEAALAAANDVVFIEPQNSAAHAARGDALRALHRNPLAQRAYETALLFAPPAEQPALRAALASVSARQEPARSTSATPPAPAP